MNIKPFFLTFLILATTAMATPKLAPGIGAGQNGDGDDTNIDIQGGFWWYIHIGRHGNKCHNNTYWGKKVCWDRDAGLTCCKNQCVNLDLEPSHCGACGIVCPFNAKCCRGKCVNMMLDPYNCGNCNNKCPHNGKCHAGMCNYAA